MVRFAQKTQVPVERTKTAIDALLRKYGASEYVSGWDHHTGRCFVQFTMDSCRVRMNLLIPTNATAVYEREQWRALFLVTKAKLVAVEAQISTFQEEFLAHIVTKDGRTIGERMMPALEAAAAEGELPTLPFDVDAERDIRLLPAPEGPARTVGSQ